MNILDYIKINSNSKFSKQPFNEIDAAIFAQLCYLRFEDINKNILIKDISKIDNYKEIMLRGRDSYPQDEELLDLIIKSKRFKDVEILDSVFDFDVQKEMQFAATIFKISFDKIVIAYRGTDGTVVGWKENLNMIYMPQTNGQIAAKDYLEKIARRYPTKRFVLTGHSKGGNIATYAATFSNNKAKNQIKRVYNFDGPGFRAYFYKTTQYKNISNKIFKFVPQTAIFGRLFRSGDFEVIKSNNTLAWQHLIYSWIVSGNKFVRLEDTDMISDNFWNAGKQFMDSFDYEERKEFVDALYLILTASDCYYIDDIVKNKDSLFASIEAYIKTDRSKKEMMIELVKSLISDIISSGVSEIKKSISKKIEKIKSQTMKDNSINKNNQKVKQ